MVQNTVDIQILDILFEKLIFCCIESLEITNNLTLENETSRSKLAGKTYQATLINYHRVPAQKRKGVAFLSSGYN